MPREEEHDTVDCFLCLDVRELARAPGFPRGGWSEARAESASWSIAGVVVEVVANDAGCGVLIFHGGCSWGVVLDFEACHLGGARPWFMCPSCGRRCAVLYLRDAWACRRCHQLRYPSQREDRFARACRRRDRIMVRLGSEPGPALVAWKPPRMRWRTFHRLLARAHQADDQATRLLAGEATQFLAGVMNLDVAESSSERRAKLLQKIEDAAARVEKPSLATDAPDEPERKRDRVRNDRKNDADE